MKKENKKRDNLHHGIRKCTTKETIMKIFLNCNIHGFLI